MTDFTVNATPKFLFDRLIDITIDDLKRMNVKAVSIDLDNTSVYNWTNIPLKGVKAWVRKVKDAGFKVSIVSNSFELRGKSMGKFFGCPSFGPAKKPDTKMILMAAEKMGVDIHEMTLIGDRLFTDVVCANNSGAVSVYVKSYKRERMIPSYWKKARQDEIDYLKKINVNRDFKSIYYK